MLTQALHQHPAWFGSVMGTAALSVAMYQSGLALVALEWVSPHTTPAAALTWASVAFLVLASVLAAILTPRYLIRSKDREALAHEMSHPAHGAMLATFPAGFLVLAVAWGRVGPEFISTDPALAVSAVLIVVGALGAVALSVVWAAAQGRGVATLADVHGGWHYDHRWPTR